MDRRITLRERLGLRLLGLKAQQPPLVEEWQTRAGYEPVTWTDYSFEHLTTEAYKSNSAVYQCINTLQFKYNEPTPVVKKNDDPVKETHPLQRLLDKPNSNMSHAELMLYVISYKAVGGQCYLYKLRNGAREVVGLIPYHSGQVRPVPGQYEWVDHYQYGFNTGRPRDIPVEDVIHLKWPAVDLSSPWLALPPLIAAAQQVDTDSELTRMLKAVLENDAMPRTIIQMPNEVSLSQSQKEAMAAGFSARHGGGRRGGVGITERGATIARVSLNMQELAIEAIRRIPESRIAGAFRVPAILAGLYVGLEKATYSNFQEARRQLTEDTFMPMWSSDAQELTQGLAADFGDEALVVEYDTHNVAALQEDEGAKWTRAIQAFDSNVATKNEVREYIGYGPVGKLKVSDSGDTFSDGSIPENAAPQPLSLDVTPQPAQLMAEEEGPLLLPPPKSYPYPLAFAELKRAQTTPVEKAIEKAAARYLAGEYEKAAAAAAELLADGSD